MDSPVTLDWFENNIRLVYMYGDPQEIISSSIISVHSLENPERHGRVPERVLSAFRWLSIDVRIILNCQTSTGNME